jgi:dihydrofolate reductase
MRKVIYGGACSLDGFLTGPGGSLDWLHFSKDVEAIIAKSFANADAILYGRKSWDVAVANGSSGSPAGNMRSYVFSRTLDRLPVPGVELVRSDAGAFVSALKARPGKDILVMSGGDFARSLFQARLIDEVALNIHPVLLGSGVPAFRDPGMRISLELAECRPLDGGCTLVSYRVAR